MSARLPFFAHDSPRSVLAWRAGTALTAGQFLADVERLAERLPPGRHVLNLCADRYRFTVGLLASMLCAKVSLLPPTYVPAVVSHLRAHAPDAFCLTDDATLAIDLPIVQCPLEHAPPVTAWRVPLIPADQCVAHVFTSGSTGAPVAHPKTWGQLSAGVAVEADRMSLSGREPAAIVATVPPQHMYGLETSVLLALYSGSAFAAERPFYPGDIAATLERVPGERILVSTPVHLRAMLAAGLDWPPLRLVVCATAMLERELAEQIEAHFRAPLIEIYGSTETGQIASRFPTQSAEWRLWPDVELRMDVTGVWASGRNLEAPTRIGDVIELTRSGYFLLRGRTADLVNIAGKRSSLAYLTHQLTQIPGVRDGAFHFPEDSAAGVTRLSALAVAPGMTAATILRELRSRIDPVFLPRPLLLVDALPRNATGKLPRASVTDLTACASLELSIPADHPAFAGHFPGTPIVPGVVLLDETLHAIALARGHAIGACQLEGVKFHGVLRPGERLGLRFERDPAGAVRFELDSLGRRIASGTIAFDG